MCAAAERTGSQSALRLKALALAENFFSLHSLCTLYIASAASLPTVANPQKIFQLTSKFFLSHWAMRDLFSFWIFKFFGNFEPVSVGSNLTINLPRRNTKQIKIKLSVELIGFQRTLKNSTWNVPNWNTLHTVSGIRDECFTVFIVLGTELRTPSDSTNRQATYRLPGFSGATLFGANIGLRLF